MIATLVVAAREIAERKLVLLGALLAGLLPLLAPLLPSLGGAEARDARFVTALFLSITIAVAFPLVFGVTILVSDIARKRIAFYFSRSLPAASIWAGKLLAALLISVFGVFLAVLPTLLLDGKRAFAAFDTSGPATAYFLLATVLLILGAHTVSSMASLRSAWIGADFFLAVFFSLAAAVSLRSLLLAGFWDLEARRAPEWLGWWLAVPLLAALLAASYVQVADGRTDARRSHGALSATLWGVATLLVGPLAGLAWWVNASTPSDLVAVDPGVPAAWRGSWVDVSGPLRARGAANAAFLYDTASGRFLKRPGGGAVIFSADGARAAWQQVDRGFLEWKPGSTLHVATLDAAGIGAITIGVKARAWSALALSPSGRRLAVYDGTNLSAYDIADPSRPRQIAAFRKNTSRGFAFPDEDTIRLFPRVFGASPREREPRELEIEELSLLSKKSLVTGRLERALKSERLSADGKYLVGTQDGSLVLHDGRTGAVLSTLSENLEAPKMRFLSGDRLLVGGVSEGKGTLKIFLEGGKSGSASPPPVSMDLGPAANLVLGGEIAPGRISVALNPYRGSDKRARSAWKLAIVDVGAAKVVSTIDGLVPADRFSWWFSPTLAPASAGLPISRLFLDADSRLVRLDPATGAQSVLLGRSK